MDHRTTFTNQPNQGQPSNSTPSIVNAISIDVEDYFHVTGFESSVSRQDWDHFPSRVVDSTRRVLALLDRHGTRATFFVVGWIAKKFPLLIKEIDAAGHELGSHSYWHRLVYNLTPDEFRDDLRRSKHLLEDIIGRSVESFRAPTFSITDRSLWALDILVEEGIRFDSSIFPTRHDRYGIPDAERTIHPIETSAGVIWEFPLPVAKFSGLTLPASGGGYFRIYPYWLSKKLIGRINRAGHPVMFYFHPWEIDPGQPIVPGVGYVARKRHRINLASTAARLERLLQDFRFSSMSDVIESRYVGQNIDRIPIETYQSAIANA